MFEDLETVVLKHDIKEYNLKEGDVGAVVNIYDGGKVAEIEFITAIGKTVALVTLKLSDVRRVKKNDLLHVRDFATA